MTDVSRFRPIDVNPRVHIAAREVNADKSASACRGIVVARWLGTRALVGTRVRIARKIEKVAGHRQA
jgi:hypothetical protein